MIEESSPKQIKISDILNEKDKEKLKYFISNQRIALLDYDYKNLDENGQNILHFLCKEGNKEIILELIGTLRNENRDEEVESLINREDFKKWTPQYYAIDGSENGFPEIVGKNFKLNSYHRLSTQTRG